MKRVLWTVFVLLLAVSTASAQIGRRATIQAGSPEDKALQEISNTSDSAKKVELLNKYLADYGGSDAVLAGYDMILSHYLSEKNPVKVYEYADKALAVDSENFNLAFFAFRAAQESNDSAKLMHYGEILGGILSRYKFSAPPSGTGADAWAGQKRVALSELQNNITYAEYSMFSAGNSAKDPAAKADLLSKFVQAFPESPYASIGATLAADAFRQARQGPKMVEFAQTVLAKDPNQYGLLVQLADYWAENGEQLDKAIESASKALEILNSAAAPQNLTPEQWAQQKGLQSGMAYAAIGQAQAKNSKYAEAAEQLNLAAPLLKPYDFYYARCKYLLGFSYARLKKTAEAKAALNEAASLNTPYKGLAQEEIGKLGAAPAKKARKRS